MIFVPIKLEKLLFDLRLLILLFTILCRDEFFNVPLVLTSAMSTGRDIGCNPWYQSGAVIVVPQGLCQYGGT